MPTREVSRDQWAAFFEVFTAKHLDRLVSLGIEGEPPKYESTDIEARELPLREVAADLKDRENTVVISLGLSSDKLLRHAIPSVSRVRVAQTEDGSDSTLTIESRNGQTTTLNLDVSAAPTS